MRIAVVNDGLERETLSVPRLSFEQARFLGERGHETRWVGTVPDRAQAGERETEGVRTLALFSRYPVRFRSLFGLVNPRVLVPFRRFLARFRPEIVHFHNVHSHVSYAALGLAARSGARVLLTAHDVMLFWSGKLARFDAATRRDDFANGAISFRSSWRERLAAERLRYLPGRQHALHRQVEHHVERTVAVSEALRRALAENGYTRVTAIPNGVDRAAFAAPPQAIADFRRRHALDGTQVLLFGGRWSDLKGVAPLVGAVDRLHRPGLRLLVIGGGSERAERDFRQRVARAGLEPCVTFAGWLSGDELAAAYGAADVCVNPSLCFETQSLFNLEAAAAGRPVVSTFFGGAAETVADGETGLLVNPHDVGALAAAIGRLLDDPATARAMGERGRESVRRQFDAPTQMAAVERLYDAS